MQTAISLLLTLRSLNNFILALIALTAVIIVWRARRQSRQNGEVISLLRAGLVYLVERVYLVITAYLVGAGHFTGWLVLLLLICAVINQFETFHVVWYFIKQFKKINGHHKPPNNPTPQH